MEFLTKIFGSRGYEEEKKRVVKQERKLQARDPRYRSGMKKVGFGTFSRCKPFSGVRHG